MAQYSLDEIADIMYHEKWLEAMEKFKPTVATDKYTQLERKYGHVSTSDAHIQEQDRLYWESERGTEDRRISGC